MKHRYFLLLTILLLTTVSVNAQRRTRSVVSESSQVVKNYLDSLNVMRKRLDSLQQVNNQLRQEQSDGRYTHHVLSFWCSEDTVATAKNR